MKALSFLHEALPARVVFDRGALARIQDEANLLGIRRALVVSTPGQQRLAGRVEALLGDRFGATFAGARMHTPVEISEAACAEYVRAGCDGVIAIGGGSTTGLAKAIALRTDAPQIIIPTTYAGSEVTPVLGETRDGEKTTQRSLKVLPETVLYDVELTLALPRSVSITSGFNAIAHAAEALYAADVSPVVEMMAEDGARALARALPLIAALADDIEARSEALYGAWLCGSCLGLVGMGLHHKLCHVLGGSFALPHAETHTVLLPHALAYNFPVATGARARLARALGVEDPAYGLHDLAKRLGAPTALRALGMTEEDIAVAARIAVARPYPNPRALDEPAIAALLRRAWSGEAPQP